jgi:hypothetical protein
MRIKRPTLVSLRILGMIGPSRTSPTLWEIRQAVITVRHGPQWQMTRLPRRSISEATGFVSRQGSGGADTFEAARYIARLFGRRAGPYGAVPLG